MNPTLPQKQAFHPVPEIVIKSADDFYFAFNVRSPNIVVMDSIGKEFLDLCDGKRGMAEIMDLLVSKYPNEVSRVELEAFARSMVTHSFLSTDPTTILQGPKKTSPVPLKLYANITRACNLTCKYCYIDAGEPYQNELDKEEWISEVEEFSQLGGREVVITGGEPFLRKEIMYAVISTARKQGIDKIDVETNGTLIGEEDALFCRENSATVFVGLGGASAETHRQVRGRGFEDAVKGIRNLVAAGVETMMGMTLTRINEHEAEDFVKLAKRLGAKTISMNSVSPVGRARKYPETAIPPQDMEPIVRSVVGEANELGVKTAFETVVMEAEQLPARNLCGAGSSLLSIAANGDVYPCNNFQRTPYKAGNVREKRLAQIWAESEVFRMLRRLDIADIAGCRDCEWRYICSGGCIAQTYHATGTIMACSPYCSYYRSMYLMLTTRIARKLWNKTQ